MDHDKIAAIFKALSDPTRVQILKIVQARERSVNEIVDFFSLSQPTISRHLSTLANCGLLNARRFEQQKLYSVNKDNLLNLLKEYFGEFECCQGFTLKQK